MSHFKGDQDEKRPNERPFVKLYLDHICDLKCASSGGRNVLMALVGIMNYNSLVAVRPKILESIADECGFKGKNKVQQVRNKISELNKLKLLKKVDIGTYAINPWYFARGEWSKILNDRHMGIEGIRFTTIFTDNGAQHKAEIESKTDKETGEYTP